MIRAAKKAAIEYWRPKPVPLLTWGRLSHAVVGAALCFGCSQVWGYAGLAVGVLLSALLAWSWERATHYLAPLAGWPHPYGDVRDLAAYVVGALLVAVPAAQADTEITSLPFTASTNSERYYLTGNLTTSSTGVRVTGTGVTIDLQGHSISQSAGATVLLDVDASGCTVEDGSLISVSGAAERTIDATNGANLTLMRVFVFNSAGSYACYVNQSGFYAESCFFYASTLQANYFHDGAGSATLINCTSLAESTPALYTRMDGGDTMTLTNSIFARGSAGGTSGYVVETRNATWSGLTATYNHFYRTSGTALIRYQGTTYTDAETFEGNSTDGDPLFVNWTTAPTGDWALQSGSVCIDDGTNTPVTSATDVEGGDRIENTTVDKGAWEEQVGGGDPTGACCISTTCSVTTEAGCAGTYQGDGTDCDPDPCAAPPADTGACCFSNGSCAVTTEAACSGTYEGDDTVCSPNPCDQPGEDHVDLSGLTGHPRFFDPLALIEELKVDAAPGGPKAAQYAAMRTRAYSDIGTTATANYTPFNMWVVGMVEEDAALVADALRLFQLHLTTNGWGSASDGDHYKLYAYDVLYGSLSAGERSAIEVAARSRYPNTASSRRRYTNLAANEVSHRGMGGLMFYGQGGDDNQWQGTVDKWVWQFEGSHDWDADGTNRFRGGIAEILDIYYAQGMHHKGVHYGINKAAIDHWLYYAMTQHLGLANPLADAVYVKHWGEQLAWQMRPDRSFSRLMNGEQFDLDYRGTAAAALSTRFNDDALSRWVLGNVLSTSGAGSRRAANTVLWWKDGTVTAPADTLGLAKFFGSQGADNDLDGDQWAEQVVIRNGWNFGSSSDDIYFSAIARPYFDGFQFYGPAPVELYGYGGVLLNQGGRYAYGGGMEDENYNRNVSRNVAAVLDPSQSSPGDIWGIDHQYNEGGNFGPEKIYDVDNDTQFDLQDFTRWDDVQDPAGATLYYSRALLNPSAAYHYNPRDIDLQEREIAVSWPYIVVRDHIDTGDPDYYLKVLWHSIYTPSMSTSEVGQVVDGHVEDFALGRVTWKGTSPRGKLIIDPLLPSDATVRRVGGTGYECWVYNPATEAGTNYPLAPADTAQYRNEYEVGRWRIETTAPAGDTLADFVHVLQVLPNAATPVDTAPIDSATAIGAEFNAHAYVFGKAPADSVERIFRTSDSDTMMVYVFRMAADSLYDVDVDGSTELQVLSDGGPIMVEIPSGIVHIHPAGDQPATGACCFPNGSCSVTTEASCTGDYQGDETTCTPNPCPAPVGACCQDSGACSVTTQAACGGAWQGAETVCSPNPCPFPVGRCCLDSGACVDSLTQAECADTLGYDWMEDATCAEEPCTGRGACCIDTTCFAPMEPADCAVAGGQWQGAGTDCDGDPCAQTVGACCVSTTCYLLTETVCETDSLGTYQGDGTDCVPDPCAGDPVGACCDLGDGTCVVLTESLCDTVVGEYQGDATDCDPNPCTEPPITGACCIGEECLILEPGDCASAGGIYQGDDTSCFRGRCPIEAFSFRVSAIATNSTMLLEQDPDPAGYCLDTLTTVAYQSNHYADQEVVGVWEFEAPTLPRRAQIEAVELRATVHDTTGIVRVNVYASRRAVDIDDGEGCVANWLRYDTVPNWQEAGAHGSTFDRVEPPLASREGFPGGGRIVIGEGYGLVAWVRDTLMEDGTAWLILDADHNSSAEVSFLSATSSDPPELVIWYRDAGRRRPTLQAMPRE